jgi:hypothetical protein
MQIGGSLTRGLLCSIQTVETRTADPRGPEPSALHLGPWAFRVGVVVIREFISNLNTFI